MRVDHETPRKAGVHKPGSANARIGCLPIQNAVGFRIADRRSLSVETEAVGVPVHLPHGTPERPRRSAPRRPFFPVWCWFDEQERAGRISELEARRWKYGIYERMVRWGLEPEDLVRTACL